MNMPLLSKLADSVEHDEPVSKAELKIWLNGICDDTLTED